MFENKGSNVLLIDNPTRRGREAGDQQFSHASKAQTKFVVQSPPNMFWNPQISGQAWGSASSCWQWQHNFQTFRKESWRSTNRSTDVTVLDFREINAKKTQLLLQQSVPSIAVSNVVLDNCLPVKCYTSKGGTDPSLLLRQSNVKSSKTSATLCLPSQEITRWVLCFW